MRGYPGSSAVKNPAANTRDMSSVPGLASSLQKETATRSSILAWEIPRTEESNRLLSMGSQRVGQDLVTKQQQINSINEL